MSLSFPNPYTVSHAETWISLNLTSPYNHFVICTIESPKAPIGGIGIKPGTFELSHTGEIGYWLSEEYQGRGLMSEAAEAVTGWAFDDGAGGREKIYGSGYRRLWGRVFSENEGSMRVLERVGYVKEGVLRRHVEKNGVVMDMHMFGITKEDWKGFQERRDV